MLGNSFSEVDGYGQTEKVETSKLDATCEFDIVEGDEERISQANHADQGKYDNRSPGEESPLFRRRRSFGKTHVRIFFQIAPSYFNSRRKLVIVWDAASSAFGYDKHSADRYPAYLISFSA